LFPGKLPIPVEDRDDTQQVFTTTEEAEIESAPPLPPKPPAGRF
jgi:hypothetical protein